MRVFPKNSSFLLGSRLLFEIPHLVLMSLEDAVTFKFGMLVGILISF